MSFFFYRSWVLQFEDLLLVQTKLAMLQLNVCVCVCGRGGGFASVMSTVGDYPMLINAHAPSLRLYLNFEQCRETTASCVNPLTTTASPINIQILDR